LVEAVETAATKLEELLEDVDDVVLDDAPTRTEEFRGESVRAGGFVRRQLLHRLPNLIRREGRDQVVQVGIQRNEVLQVERVLAHSSRAQHVIEVRERSLRHISLPREQRVAMLQRADHVLLSSVTALAVEERCVRVPVFQPSDSGALPGDGSLQRGKFQVRDFELLV
jgi:hypothetical protein